jgi:hypothetical protein
LLMTQDYAMVEVSLLESLKIKIKVYWYTLKFLSVMVFLSLIMSSFLMPYYTGDSVDDLIRIMRRRSNRELLSMECEGEEEDR